MLSDETRSGPFLAGLVARNDWPQLAALALTFGPGRSANALEMAAQVAADQPTLAAFLQWVRCQPFRLFPEASALVGDLSRPDREWRILVALALAPVVWLVDEGLGVSGRIPPGLLTDAIEHCDRMAELMTPVFGPARANRLRIAARLRRRRGAPPAAVTLASAAVALARTEASRTPLFRGLLADGLVELAGAREELDDHVQALAAEREATRLWGQVVPDRDSLRKLALALARVSQLALDRFPDVARRAAEKTIDVIRDLGADATPTAAMGAQILLAQTELVLGDSVAAREAAASAVGIAGDGEGANAAAIVHARALLRSRNRTEAVECLERLLSTRPDGPAAAELQVLLAAARSEQGEWPEAERACRQAIAALNDTTPTSAQAVAQLQLGLIQFAARHRSGGRESLARAEQLFQRISEDQPWKLLPERFACHLALADGETDHQHGILLLTQAMAVAERLVRRTADPAARRLVLDRMREPQDRLICRLCPDLDSSMATALAAEAFAVAECGVAGDLIDLRAELACEEPTVPAEVLARWQAKRVALRRLDRAVEGKDDAAAVRAERRRTRQDADDLLEELHGATMGRFDPWRGTEWPSVATLREMIPTDCATAFVHLHAGQDRSVALLLSRDRAAAVPLAEDLVDIMRDQLTGYYDAWLTNGNHPVRTTEWERALECLLRRVSRSVVAPLMPALQDWGMTRLVISPGPLHGVPFAACALPNGSWLGDRFEITVTPAFALLRPASGRAASNADVFSGIASPGSLLHEAELHWSARHYPHAVVNLYARREQVMQLARQGGTLHYSGHVKFELTAPHRSALMLRDILAATSKEWLTADHILDLRLPPDTCVILSGCESALLRADRQGNASGLATTFLVAGCRVVVGSLWPVGNLATVLMMDRFHAFRREGRGEISALSAAQKWLRDQIPSGPHLREKILGPMLEALPPDLHFLRAPCMREAELLENNFPKQPPFASPVVWSSFIVVGRGW